MDYKELERGKILRDAYESTENEIYLYNEHMWDSLSKFWSCGFYESFNSGYRKLKGVSSPLSFTADDCAFIFNVDTKVLNVSYTYEFPGGWGDDHSFITLKIPDYLFDIPPADLEDHYSFFHGVLTHEFYIKELIAFEEAHVAALLEDRTRNQIKKLTLQLNN